MANLEVRHEKMGIGSLLGDAVTHYGLTDARVDWAARHRQTVFFGDAERREGYRSVK